MHCLALHCLDGHNVSRLPLDTFQPPDVERVSGAIFTDASTMY